MAASAVALDMGLLCSVLLCSVLLCSVPVSCYDGVLSVNVGQLDQIATVSDRFLSVAIDSHVVAERWKNFDFQSEKVLNMAAVLAPAYMRLGGTAADLLTFVPNTWDLGNIPDKLTWNNLTSSESSRPWCSTSKNGSIDNENLSKLYKERKKFVMTGKDLETLYNFCQAVGWSLLFDLNVLKRKGKSWDSGNAKQLLHYAERNDFQNISFELGNEPNSLKHHLNFTLPARQLGKDFWKLKALLKQSTFFENSTLVGPDINGVRKCSPLHKKCKALTYLEKVLSTSGGVLDAITWHQYYLDGHTANLSQFVDVNVLDQLHYQLDLVTSFTQTSSPGTPLWLGETSSAYGGGAHGLSNSFVAGFNWLDKLGQAAKFGHQVVIRQSFYHGCYALLDESLNPYPDFWLSALYKILVGKTVLETGVDNKGKTTRLYAHCAKNGVLGSVVIFGFNMGVEMSKLTSGKLQQVEGYILQPVDGNLQSKNVLLNGKTLELVEGKRMPKMNPTVTLVDQILLDKNTIGFWVLPNAGNKQC